ncbi:hypothetical protein HMPREF0201_02369 [Cedecea davisae DSM 4568]|uniref:Uncharacterized protein n=1 Tax=Cedecea davisae DSM 4568 TaxID=566551 RepID=S3ISC3_9ENTR|nr:hypothetical protein HMPREF0201_02369 [Cedecea davisae DSM 4568]
MPGFFISINPGGCFLVHPLQKQYLFSFTWALTSAFCCYYK